MNRRMKLRHTFAALGLALSMAGAAHAQAVEGLDGRWEGPITLGTGATITGVFRVETKAGVTTVLMDSPDQGARDIPASVKREGQTVTFEVPSAMVTYTATLSADGKMLSGDLSQGGGAVPVTMKQTPASASAAALTGPAIAGLDGRWEGEIVTPNGSLSGIFRISTAGGKTTTLMDVPAQNVAGIPALAKREGQKITIDVPGIAGSFSADLSADGKTLDGFWDQAGMSFPLAMTRN